MMIVLDFVVESSIVSENITAAAVLIFSTRNLGLNLFVLLLYLSFLFPNPSVIYLCLNVSFRYPEFFRITTDSLFDSGEVTLELLFRQPTQICSGVTTGIIAGEAVTPFKNMHMGRISQ